MKSIKKVIDLYFDELSGGNLCNRYPEYQKKEDAYKAVLAKLSDDDRESVDLAVFEMVAAMEKLTFEDGFKAAIRHVKELCCWSDK